MAETLGNRLTEMTEVRMLDNTGVGARTVIVKMVDCGGEIVTEDLSIESVKASMTG